MSRMIMIRHGQASFLSDDYDRLSALGLDQARQLGEYWRAQQMQCDAAFCGPRRRHRETADCVLDSFQLEHTKLFLAAREVGRALGKDAFNETL